VQRNEKQSSKSVTVFAARGKKMKKITKKGLPITRAVFEQKVNRRANAIADRQIRRGYEEGAGGGQRPTRMTTNPKAYL